MSTTSDTPKPAQYPSRVADQFQVRFPDGMRDQIAEAAKAAGRSMNAEIVARLHKSFEIPGMQGFESLRLLPSAEELERIMMRAVHVELRRAAAEQLELAALPQKPGRLNRADAAPGGSETAAPASSKPRPAQVRRVELKTNK